MLGVRFLHPEAGAGRGRPGHSAGPFFCGHSRWAEQRGASIILVVLLWQILFLSWFSLWTRTAWGLMTPPPPCIGDASARWRRDAPHPRAALHPALRSGPAQGG